MRVLRFKFTCRAFAAGADAAIRLSVVMAAIVLTFSGSLSAQTDEEPFDPNAAPPPIKAMSKIETERLATTNDVKDHTKIALELMDARLTKAEEFNVKGEFADMYAELGGFHALMDNTLDFLLDQTRREKILSNFKRFEIGLRTFGPRLGLIRRGVPAEYDHYVKVLIRYLRDARSKAVEPLFGNSVVPNQRT